MQFKSFQKSDYARAAMHDGLILGHDTGLGKTMAMFTWPVLKTGLHPDAPLRRQLLPAQPVLLVVPGDGHDQTEDEYRRHFCGKSEIPIIRLDSQEAFRRLAQTSLITGKLKLPPAYYLTSYTQLTGNGVADFPPLNRAHPEVTMSHLHLTEADAVAWWNQRGQIYQKHYERLSAGVRGGGTGTNSTSPQAITPDSSLKQIEGAMNYLERHGNSVVVDLARESWHILQQLTPDGSAGAGRRESQKSEVRSQKSEGKRFNAAASSPSPRCESGQAEVRSGHGERAGVRCHTWEQLNEPQQSFVRSELIIARHREFSAGLGETRPLPPLPLRVAESAEPGGEGRGEVPSEIGNRKSAMIKCVYSPSLADLCQDCFAAIVIDEGTKIKGDTTLIGTGVRQINAAYRLVLTATPIKNRFPDLFHLAHYVCGGHAEPTPRFPYGQVDKETFAAEFLVTERNLSKEDQAEAKGEKRRFIKFTPQVTNVHKVWKLFAPVILRRRKEDCGEDIVPKLRHVVRVPMGLYQAAAYQFHLKAKYRDKNGLPAIGAKLQALRIAAANPASDLLQRPEHDGTTGNPRSGFTYIPKVASALELVRAALERREQVIIGSAFQNGLDVFSARLQEAGVPHLVLDGRTSQKRRGELARLFKQGSPRAVDEGLVRQASKYPVLLAGQECMAELHSFNFCNNVLLTAYSWSFDKFEQFINRAHRLNSPWPVNVWSVICEGSIDRKLEGSIHEKADAAGLVLDGHLLGETPAEVNLAELLHIAEREFKNIKTLDEHDLEQGWPRLRAALGKAYLAWQTLSPRLAESAEPKGDRAGMRCSKSEIGNRKSEIGNLPLWRQRWRNRKS